MRCTILHAESYHEARVSRNYMTAQGALVLMHRGLYWYHDSTTWVPTTGLSASGWIRTFHCPPPNMEEGCWAIVMGITDDTRPLMDVWTAGNVLDCLRAFPFQFPGEYIMPSGEVMDRLMKAWRLGQKHKAAIKRVTASVDKHVSPAPVEVPVFSDKV